jgi:hypothetical protein
MAATKKRGATKKASTKKASTKKASTKKAAVKKASKKASQASSSLTPPKKFCSNWKAWQNRMPMAMPTINVVGTCTFPTPGYKAKLVKAVPQGFNPAILLLRLMITKSSGPIIQPTKKVEVRYTAKTGALFTHVTILPDGVTVKVQQVM